MDLTYLKKILSPESYAVNDRPVGLTDFLLAPSRVRSFTTMLSTVRMPASIEGQGLAYMARRIRGHIKGHIMTHLHVRIVSAFKKRYFSFTSTVPDCIDRALIEADYSALHLYPELAWRVVKFREFLALNPDEIAGKRLEEDEEEAMMGEVDGDGEDEAEVAADAPMVTGWKVHRRLCDLGIATLLPLADLRLQHSIIDSRIAFYLVKHANRSLRRGHKLMEVCEGGVFERYFTPSISFLKARKKRHRRQEKGKARKQVIFCFQDFPLKKQIQHSIFLRQYRRAGIGRFVPKDGIMKSFQTDSVAATATFDVPIAHSERVMVKRQALEERILKMSKSELDELLEARRIAIDPGDVNTIASVELLRPPKEGSLDPHRPQINTHLSKKYYERRTLRTQHAKWEASRRRDNVLYAHAIQDLSSAGTFKTTDIDKMDAMLAAKAEAWPHLRQELVFDKQHAIWKMQMYRRRRMVLDQAARRFLDPKVKGKPVHDKKDRGIVVGYGNGKFGSMGPRVAMIRAVVRILKQMRTPSRPLTLLVFVDEFRTTLLCHRCFGKTKSPKKKNCKGNSVEDHRFRDCPHCGSQTTNKKRWGRDENAALNILRNLSCLLERTPVPAPFQRSTAHADLL